MVAALACEGDKTRLKSGFRPLTFFAGRRPYFAGSVRTMLVKMTISTATHPAPMNTHECP